MNVVGRVDIGARAGAPNQDADPMAGLARLRGDRGADKSAGAGDKSEVGDRRSPVGSSGGGSLPAGHACNSYRRLSRPFS
jgi:hypothetical protein